ncbi:MAG TPA: MG2 domain-containing protein [Pyrinomonadaceae bacterium]|nr:MG2 domain-containing protein [Pyrinomonadaceae bacterium]
MKTIISIALFGLLYLLPNAAQQADYSKLKSDAEQFYASGSYARANEIYARADRHTLSPAEARWVDFRIADTSWRAQAGTETADTTKFELAQKQLEELIRTNDKDDERDLVWAEAHESLGDFFWTRRNQMNWGGAWPHYQQALDWWAGQRESEVARKRYLRIVFKAAEPPEPNEYYVYTYYGNYIPLDVLENALKISPSANDQAHLHFLIAMTMRNTGDMETRQGVPDEFEAALKAGKQTAWYDDALFHYAEWMNSSGIIRQLDEGQWQQEPDYVKALELYRRFTREFAKGQTRYYDQAIDQIKQIIDPTLSVAVSNIFLPDSELQFSLEARNIRHLDFALYKIDLTHDVRFTKNLEEDEGDGEVENWIQKPRVAGRAPVKAWAKDLDSKGDHKERSEEVRINGKLPLGAYLLEARSGSLSARDLVLITDASLVLKSSAKQALVYFSNAVTGAPIANANVTLWESYYDKDRWHSRRIAQTTNSDGLAPFQLKNVSSSRNLYAAAAINTGSNDRQAFASGSAGGNSAGGDAWRIYAFTDRPAYRPKETVQWKFIARRLGSGIYSTPANQIVEYQINDPRGTKVSEGKATLNSFGSAWASLDLGEQLPLGEYNVQFWDQGRKNSIGGAKLFRLEEYKLPEFRVAVKTPEENGRKKSFRLGEKVEVAIQADYYFGGPVSNAAVEVVVYQNPFYHYWYPHHDYSWYYDDLEQQRVRGYYGGQGQIVKRETIKTDAGGRAVLTFPTPRENYNQDFEYRIEARVTDSSRREIVAGDRVRVTRWDYYVYPRAERNIYRPQEKVTVDFKALDANEQPVTTEGTVKITRDYWWEVWLDPSGREVKGNELRLLQQRSEAFPPPVTKGKPWRLKFRGYQHEDILTRNLKTDEQGAAQLQFTPERDGYYRVSWESSQVIPGATKRTRLLPPIKAETYVFVATNATSELGYRHEGVEIIVDRDTFRSGQTAAVMLSVFRNDRYVLFSVETDDLYSYKLVHVTGTAKLIEVPIEESHVPNIFLNALMVSDAELFEDTKQIVVPPVEHFLSVDMKPEREQYQPREEGTFSITARDQSGKPVAAEIALSLIDESVNYIQRDYAGDPRQFYYGSKRSHSVQTESTFSQKSYLRLVEAHNGQLIDIKEVGSEEDGEGGNSGGPGAGGSGYGADQVTTVTGNRDERLRKDAPAPASLADGIVAQRSISELSAAGRPTDDFRKSAAEPSPPPPGQDLSVQVRSDFRSTILWLPDVMTDANGAATVKVKYPDSLTTWQATARVATTGNQFGIGNASTRTKQPLIVRLQAPRFFVVGDEVTVSGVINNNTDQPLHVASSLTAEGLTVTGVVVNQKPDHKGGFGENNQKPDRQGGLGEPSPIEIKPGSEARVDWLVAVTQAGEAKLKVEARALDGSSKFADAMEKTFTVYEHGIEKFVSRSGKLRGDSVAIKLYIPKARRTETTGLVVQIAPSMATTMLDALPYLVDYPYGCTEQTMSRFLPAAITAKTLRDVGLKPEDAMHKIFGGIERSGPDGPAPGSGNQKPKHDLKELDRITRQSLERLYNFQHADGGWGWWKDGDSDHFMTAYVLWGMTLARQAGIEVKQDVAARGATYLDKELVEEETNYDEQAWMLHALAAHLLEPPAVAGGPDRGSSPTVRAGAVTNSATDFQSIAFDNLFANRDRLNAYTRALLALAAHSYGYHDKAKTLIENLENGVQIDSQPHTSIVQQGGPTSDPSVIATAHWGEDGIYWHWSEGGVEATSFVVRALLTIDPQNKLVEPATNWLLKNRRGAQWSNTRDTAIVVLTLNDYLRTTREAQPELSYELLVNGNSVASKQITAADALSAPSKFEIPREVIRDGANEITIRRTSGAGPLYFSAQAKFFSLEEPITAAGNEIFVRRQYFKLVNHATLLKGFVSERVPLNDGDTVRSGERVETVITIEAKNNYEYLLFEDLKPAGLEAVQLRSGENLFVKELKSAALSRVPSTMSNVQSPGSNESANTGTAGVSPALVRTASGSDRANGLAPDSASNAGRAGILPALSVSDRSSLVSTASGSDRVSGGNSDRIAASKSSLMNFTSAFDFTGRTRWVYQELRDRKVALFIDHLSEGIWQLSYEMRAESPGTFHALPVLGHAMYVPEIRTNSAEVRIRVVD